MTHRFSPLPVHRQMLVHLNFQGWQDIMRAAWPADLRDCLNHWATHDLPLVVTRQDLGADSATAAFAETLFLGLPAPQRWGHRRVALRVDVRQVGISLYDWPPLAAVLARLPAAPAGWRMASDYLTHAGLAAQVYGSHGWQHLTGLSYCHDASDLDLRIPVADLETANRAAALLAASPDDGRLLDGELCFPDGRAVAWREWWRWSQGASRVVLFKSLDGATLATPGATP